MRPGSCQVLLREAVYRHHCEGKLPGGDDESELEAHFLHRVHAAAHVDRGSDHGLCLRGEAQKEPQTGENKGLDKQEPRVVAGSVRGLEGLPVPNEEVETICHAHAGGAEVCHGGKRPPYLIDARNIKAEESGGREPGDVDEGAEEAEEEEDPRGGSHLLELLLHDLQQRLLLLPADYLTASKENSL